MSLYKEPTKSKVTKYVVGFYFCPDDWVVLIEKRRPKWQEGLLNGVGGHIEESDESSAHATAREFEEETSVKTAPGDWKLFCTMGDDASFQVECFCMIGPDNDFKSNTDEIVALYKIDAVCKHSSDMTIENLKWLIPLAVDHLTDGRPKHAMVKYPA